MMVKDRNQRGPRPITTVHVFTAKSGFILSCCADRIRGQISITSDRVLVKQSVDSPEKLDSAHTNTVGTQLFKQCHQA